MKAYKTLQALSPTELKARLLESRKEMLKLRTQAITGTSGKSIGQLQKAKKNAARILSLLSKSEALA
ncbi:50S ribosomal protein L29 [Candidatus Woesearchaeota archaeon]|nr:50S ribosomal protein L29 [Candidatus Woesearchaeota archaeon]